jgi:hypothetical protein
MLVSRVFFGVCVVQCELHTQGLPTCILDVVDLPGLVILIPPQVVHDHLVEVQ